MDGSELTPLEHAIIASYWHRYREWGFPRPSDVKVARRVNDGGGRFTHFAHAALVQLKDGQLGLGVYSQFEMANLPYGASFHVWIKDQKLDYLDITPNGMPGWSGEEAAFVIVEPEGLDTNLFHQRPH